MNATGDEWPLEMHAYFQFGVVPKLFLIYFPLEVILLNLPSNLVNYLHILFIPHLKRVFMGIFVSL